MRIYLIDKAIATFTKMMQDDNCDFDDNDLAMLDYTQQIKSLTEEEYLFFLDKLSKLNKQLHEQSLANLFPNSFGKLL